MSLRVAAILSFSLVAFGGRTVLAHRDHQHSAPPAPVTEEAAKALAKAEVERLAGLKKIDASWTAARLGKLERKDYGGRWEWLATFENGNVKTDGILYVFLTPSGDVIAANFTGK